MKIRCSQVFLRSAPSPSRTWLIPEQNKDFPFSFSTDDKTDKTIDKLGKATGTERACAEGGGQNVGGRDSIDSLGL